MKKKIFAIIFIFLLIGSNYFVYYEYRENVISNDENAYLKDNKDDSSNAIPDNTPIEDTTSKDNSDSDSTNKDDNKDNDKKEDEKQDTNTKPLDTTLKSLTIGETVKHYPDNNSELLNKYSTIYSGVKNEYQIYSSYYSSDYDTLYIAYDNIDSPIQELKSRDLALIEEHLLNYFELEQAKKDYEYLKVVRLYPDFASSACRSETSSEDEYSSLQGCAVYDALTGEINLNGIYKVEQFFKDYDVTKGDYIYHYNARRIVFAHEFGHVFTYYHLVLKGDDSYTNYLKLRLEDGYDYVYPSGLPTNYSTGLDYKIQPVEILADDYVELYYNRTSKKDNDYYSYDLNYNFKRNSLSNVKSAVTQYLSSDNTLFTTVKTYFDNLVYKDYTSYQNPSVININGDIYQTINDIKNNKTSLNLINKNVVALGTLNINGETYYRIILRNFIETINDRRDYSDNIAYIKSSQATTTSLQALYFQKYNGLYQDVNVYYPIETKVNLAPYYDFSYFIVENSYVYLYNHYDTTFTNKQFSLSLFQ